MLIKNVNIKNFRNLESIELVPQAKMNFFIGENGQGKTNILEAIYTAATGFSFRAYSEYEMIQYNKSEFRVSLKYVQEERLIDTYISYKETGIKDYRINTIKVSKKSQDRLNIVLFTPEDLYLVKGGPGKRRRFIDFLLRQLSPEYKYNIDNYNKILKRRNNNLKKDNKDELYSSISKEVFIEVAASIIFNRINLVNMLEGVISSIYQRLSGERDTIKIRYALSFPVQSDKINIEVIKISLAQRLEELKEKENYKKTTLAGPHLDDIHIYHQQRLAKKFSSQGQQRSIAIALKLAEIEIYEKLKREKPVLLMDEVLAELDDEKKEMLLKYLKEGFFQSFITAVDVKKLDLPIKGINRVKKGIIVKDEGDQ